ncbi:unnamed protein product [Camellia sinensis]
MLLLCASKERDGSGLLVHRICNGVESVSPSSDLQQRRDWVAGEGGFDGDGGFGRGGRGRVRRGLPVGSAMANLNRCKEEMKETSSSSSSMVDELNLLGTWISPYSTRVKIALAEKGVDYEFREEDLSTRAHLLKMNPVSKQIPELIHNDKPVCESLIIVQYTGEIWNHKSPLLPSDPHQGEAQETAKNDLIGYLKVLEGELGDKPYFGGETFGIVDVALVPSYSFFFAYEQFGNFSIVAKCPALVVWVHWCMEKESVLKHLPDQHKIYDSMLERKKKLHAKLISRRMFDWSVICHTISYI